MFMKRMMVTLVFAVGCAFAETNPFAGPNQPPPPSSPAGPAPQPPANLSPLPTPGDFPVGVPTAPPRTTLPDRLKALVQGGMIAPAPVTRERLTLPVVTLPITVLSTPDITPILSADALAALTVEYPDEAIRRYLRDTPLTLLGTVTAQKTTAIMSIAGNPKRLVEGDTLPNTRIRVARVTENTVTLNSGAGTAIIRMVGRP